MVLVPGSFKTRDIQRYDHHKVSAKHDADFFIFVISLFATKDRKMCEVSQHKKSEDYFIIV